MARKPKTEAKQVSAAPVVSAEPKKRGRKPGSKNKVQGKKRGRRPVKPAINIFESIEKEIKSMAVALKKAKMAAEKQIAKIEAKAAKAVEKAEAKAAKKIEKLKERMKAKRRPPGRPAKSGRKPGRPKAVKPPARRGRPPKSTQKRGGRPRKGQPTKKTMIIDYMKGLGKSIKSGDLIAALYANSGESDKKRFYQGIYTTLTQIYKSGELKKSKDGVITLGK
jgi:hypothetical protein